MANPEEPIGSGVLSMHKIGTIIQQQRGAIDNGNSSGEQRIITAAQNLNNQPMQHHPLDSIIVNGNVASPPPKSSHLYKI